MKNNKVVHFEIPAGDLASSKEFYQGVFGWNFKEWDENYMSVMAADSDENGESQEVGAINGGLQKKSDRAVSPTIVVQVSDIDETLKEIQDKGGTVVIEKEQMGENGFYAQFNDPDGNRLGLFQKAE